MNNQNNTTFNTELEQAIRSQLESVMENMMPAVIGATVEHAIGQFIPQIQKATTQSLEGTIGRHGAQKKYLEEYTDKLNGILQEKYGKSRIAALEQRYKDNPAVLQQKIDEHNTKMRALAAEKVEEMLAPISHYGREPEQYKDYKEYGLFDDYGIPVGGKWDELSESYFTGDSMDKDVMAFIYKSSLDDSNQVGAPVAESTDAQHLESAQPQGAQPQEPVN